MANSHERAVERKIVETALRNFGVHPTPEETIPQKKSDRLNRFLEHGSLQTLIGIVGGLVGTLLDGRYFAVLGLWVAYSLHRSRALAGLSIKAKSIIHCLGVALVSVLLFFMGVEINRSRPHVYTPADYKQALGDHTPLPIAQQVTNVYKSYFSPAKAIGEPRMDLSEFVFDGFAPDGTMLWHIKAINNGTVPALDTEGSTKGMVGKWGADTEDALFDFLTKAAHDNKQPRSDQPPGEAFFTTQPLGVKLSVEDRINLQDVTQALYLGRLDTYHDAAGNRYISERCMYFSPKLPQLHYCDGHNLTRKLPSQSKINLSTAKDQKQQSGSRN